MKKSISLIFIFFLTEISYGQTILITKSPDSTHNAVVAIMRYDSSGKLLTRATGVLIHPRVILTAGHVRFVKTYKDGLKRQGLIAPSNKAFEAKDYYTFDWINDVETYPEQDDFQKSFRDTTGKLKPAMFFDIGLIFINSPILDKPIVKLPQPMLFQELPVGINFIGVGYGYHKLRDSSFKYSYIDGIRRSWKPKSVTAINAKWLSGACDTIVKQQFTNTADSGAPIFINDDTIIGINSSGGNYPDSAKFNRLDNLILLEWIKKIVKQKIGIAL